MSKHISDDDYFPKTVYLYHSKEFPSTIYVSEDLDKIPAGAGDETVVSIYERKKVGRIKQTAQWVSIPQDEENRWKLSS